MIYGNRPPSESNLEGGFIMFKKSLAIVLVAAMTLGLTGCFQAGSNGGPDTLAPLNTSAEAGSQKEETSRHEETTEAVSSETASSEATEKGSEIASSVDKGTEESKQDKVRQVLIDNDSCRLEWTSFEIGENGDNVFNFRFENKTADTVLRCYTPSANTSYPDNGTVAVNGYLIRTVGSVYFCEADYRRASCCSVDITVDPGMNSEWSILISAKDLKALGMKTVNRLDLPINVQVSGSLPLDPYIAHENFALYPAGMGEGSFTVPERLKEAGDFVVAENEGFQYVTIGKDENAEQIFSDEGFYTLYFYLQNDSDVFIEIICEGCSLDGKKLEDEFVNTSFNIGAPPKSKSLYSINISKDRLGSLGIKEMKELLYEFIVMDLRENISYAESILADGAVTIDLTKLRKID